MTVQSDTSRLSWDGDGVTTAFPILFYFIKNADLKAVSTVDATGVETPLTEGVHYTLTGAGTNPPTGVLTMLAAPAAGVTLQAYLDPEVTQKVVVPPGRVDTTAHIETPLDRLTQIAQRFKDIFTRTVRLSDGDVAGTLILPAKNLRPNKLLGFDGTGDNLIPVAGFTGGLTPVSSFMETMLDDADAATARATIGAQSAADVMAAIASAGSGTAALMPAQCRLEFTDANNLTLVRHQGSALALLDGSSVPTIRTIPSGGVTLAPSGLTPADLYHIYAYWTGSAIALEASATVAEINTATGAEVKTGDPTRRLVGLAWPGGGPVWVQDARLASCVSFHNRKRRTLKGKFTAERTLTATSATIINSEIDILVPQIGGTLISALATGRVWQDTAFAGIKTLVYAKTEGGSFVAQDGFSAATADTDQPTANLPIAAQGKIESAASRLCRVTLFGLVSSGTGSWGGHASDVDKQTVLSIEFDG